MNIDAIIENAQLKGRIIALDAQVETLTAELRCLEAVIRAHERVDCQAVANLKAEVARLDAEVERLTTGGDDVLHTLLWTDEYSVDRYKDAEKKWNAAKEGKRS